MIFDSSVKKFWTCQKEKMPDSGIFICKKLSNSDVFVIGNQAHLQVWQEPEAQQAAGNAPEDVPAQKAQVKDKDIAALALHEVS